MDVIVRSGPVRYIGVSNVLAYRFAKARGRAQLRNPMRFVPVQPHDSLLFRENKRELLPLAAED